MSQYNSYLLRSIMKVCPGIAEVTVVPYWPQENPHIQGN